jgi:phage tail sheath protein FI
MLGTERFPGVYIEVVSGGVRTISVVSTSITVFIGRALMGPVNEPNPRVVPTRQRRPEACHKREFGDNPSRVHAACP